MIATVIPAALYNLNFVTICYFFDTVKGHKASLFYHEKFFKGQPQFCPIRQKSKTKFKWRQAQILREPEFWKCCREIGF